MKDAWDVLKGVFTNLSYQETLDINHDLDLEGPPIHTAETGMQKR